MKALMKLGLTVGLVSLAACGSGETERSEPAPAPAAESVGTVSAVESGGTVSANANKTHTGTGTVDSVSGNEVTISHGPVETLDWPAMTMPFAAPDAALLNDIKPGDRVTFVFNKTGEASTLTSISKQ